MNRLLDFLLSAIGTAWIEFIMIVLIIAFANLVKDLTPTVLAYIELPEEEAPCGINQVELPPVASRTDAGFLPKMACPRTEPAPFLDLEIDTELWLVTGYAIGDDHTPGRNTADGWNRGLQREVRPGITVACPKELPLGTMVVIDKIGPRVCEDTGGAIAGRRLDVAFPSPESAMMFGRKWLRVAIIRPEDYQ